jgi:hypothetical protein
MKSFKKSSGFLTVGIGLLLLSTAISHGAEQEKKLRLVHDGFSVATAVAWVGFSPACAAALSQNLIQGAPLSPQVAVEASRLGLKVIDIKEVPIVTSLLITTRSKINK